MGQHGQSNVPIPALPVADFVVVKPALALGGLEGLFNLPALSGHAHEGFQRGLGRGRIEAIVGMLGLFFDTAPHQQPVVPAILLPARNHGPAVQPFTFAARSCGNAFPGQIRSALCNRIHASLLVIGPAHPLV